jgi:hypothetical protein
VHSYAAGRGTWREPAPAGTDGVRDLADVRDAAGEAGFSEERVYFWRAVRFYPYVIALPEGLSRRLWHYVLFVLRRR